MARAGAEIRALRHKVAKAVDTQVRQVVETIDALDARGAADELIAPLRPRLDRMQVAHPLRLPRLLFAPLSPLLVSPKHWRLGQNTLPRSAIIPLTRLVEDAMGSRTDTIKRDICSHTTSDITLICSIGASLWPNAATALAAASAPARWRETGLSEKVFLALAAQVAALLRQAPLLDLLVIETANGLMPPDRHRIEAMVRTLTKECADALPMLAILLVERLPRAASILYDLASRRSLIGLNTAVEQAASLLLDRLELGGDVIANKGLSQFTLGARRIATLLVELDHERASRERREQIRLLRQKLDADCQAHFRIGMHDEFIMPLQACSASEGTGDLRSLEEAARSLRMLEAEGKSIGVATSYQAMMAEAVQAVEDVPATGFITSIDRVRLIEIVGGAERALAALERTPINDHPSATAGWHPI